MITRRNFLIGGAGLAGALSPIGQLAARSLADDAGATIQGLLRDMTLEEKIGQLTMGNSGGVLNVRTATEADLIADIRAGRLGSLVGVYGAERTSKLQRIAIEETRCRIPLIFGFDVVHGYSSVFPVPLGETSAFDPELWERTARMAAREARAGGVTLTFAPMIDVTRDPRWGRIVEGPGEDPWLGSQFAQAKVRGFQGNDISASNTIGATAKHIGAYGAVTAGRDYASVDISDRLFNEVYLPPFRAAVEAGVVAIMPSFVDLAGVPTTANAALLRDIVRKRWGFDGVIVSDFNAVVELVQHGIAEDMAQAASLALHAGVDIDMMGYAYGLGLPLALQRGDVTIDLIDEAVRRVLTLKAKLGLFANPYPPKLDDAERKSNRDSGRALAREAAVKSVVLLKNENGVLPLKPNQRVALVGPMATPEDVVGAWEAAGAGEHTVSIYEGLQAGLPAGSLSYAKGVDVDDGDLSGVPEALQIARDADVVILALGEAEGMSGEASSRARLGLPGRQRQLAEAVLALGKPTIALLTSGRPLTVPWLFEKAQAALATWFLGIEAGNAVADVLLGRANPSGKLPISWPVNVGQIPIFYSQRPLGRPFSATDVYTSRYIDTPIAPQFVFGHGLSYSAFSIKDVRTSGTTFGRSDVIAIEADVLNSSPLAGRETVLLFVRELVAPRSTPMMELRGVTKINLAAGQSGTVGFTLPVRALAFPGGDLSPEVQPGEFELMVGSSAEADALLRTRIRVSS